MKEASGSNNDRNPRIEAAYIEFRRMLERLAYTITRNHADAEDVVQDVFLNLLEMETFPPDFDKNPRAYLQKSAFNRAVDVYRARDCRKLADIHADIDYVGLLAASPEAGADHATVRRLRRALAELEPEAVAMLMLRYEHGYNNGEIGQMKGISHKAVSKVLNRAEEKLRRNIRIQERDVELGMAKRRIAVDPTN